MAQVSTYPLATRAAGDFLLGTNAAGQVKRFPESGRETLQADRTYYVRTGGNDANNGLTDVDGGAFATYTHAYDIITSELDFGGFAVLVRIQNAAWTTTLNINRSWTGGGGLTFDFQTGSLTVTNDNAFQATGVLDGNLQIINVTLSTVTAGFCCVRSTAAGTLYVGSGVIFGSSTNPHASASGTGAIVYFSGNYSITAGANIHLHAERGGAIFHFPGTVTITGNPNFSTAFAGAYNNGVISSFATFSSGSPDHGARGQRYIAFAGGTIETFAGGANYFPGNVAGDPVPNTANASGGYYS